MVHTPFVPSGSWSTCAPLVLNQGSPTLKGVRSVSINPVKEPDIRFSSCRFRKQHPRHEKAVSRTSLAEAVYA
ncbi:unnamed protein product [Schistosoma mattheei]|uniref:Uncharacterized protein n=1 Tax=Schistosoma mattheei TaxID=31246 RepID=A0A3P8ENM6_9TREM|nr:unnamed protein product [Schistosoma mattheei]